MQFEFESILRSKYSADDGNSVHFSPINAHRIGDNICLAAQRLLKCFKNFDFSNNDAGDDAIVGCVNQLIG